MLGEAQSAGLRIRCVFVAQEAERLLDKLLLKPGTEVLLTPGDVLCSALATETPQPVAALVEPPVWSWEDLLGPARGPNPLLVILAGLQDPGNLGTILRSSEAFGACGVVSLPGTVYAWNQKTVRASAGSVFRVPLLRATLADCVARLRQAHIRILASMAREADPATDLVLTGPLALLIGNEGNGIPAEVAAEADVTITIPCPGPVESLNAAVATSVLLYEASRQRSASTGSRATQDGSGR
jgi:TrmH family RNA methyltransferase